MSDDESSNEENFMQDFKKLKPYDHEPKKPANYTEPVNKKSKIEEQVDLASKIGNTDWCQCKNCRPMMTIAESICCRDKKEVPVEYLENCHCIVETEAFKAVCLTKPVLQTTLSALNNLRGDKIKIGSESFRFAGYKQFTWWVHNHLGKGVRKAIPSCAVWAIRNTFPNKTGIYVPFKEYKEDECRYMEYSS